MRKWLKRIAWTIGGLVAVIAVLALLNREAVGRLYTAITLFDEDRIVGNFSGMKNAFLTRQVARGGPVFEFEEAPAALPARFAAPGGEIATADYLKRTSATSLLVLRDDRIQFEAYYLGTGPDDLRISWSVAKSFLSALLGVALAEGAIDSLDDPVTKYAPALKGSAYDGATVRHVAHMASGVAFDENYLDPFSDIKMMGNEIALGGSLDAFTARRDERAGAPGENWRYVSVDTHVLGMVIRGATGRSIADLMSEKIWSRIGAEADALYITDGEGVAFVLGGLNIRTRDYARFGRLILNDGAWEGEQVIPADWVRESTADTAPPPVSAGARRGQGYGYQWWIPPNADDEFYAIGIYGQYIFIDRKARVVIVKTSADRNFRADNHRHLHESIAFFRAIARGGAK